MGRRKPAAVPSPFQGSNLLDGYPGSAFAFTLGYDPPLHGLKTASAAVSRLENSPFHGIVRPPEILAHQKESGWDLSRSLSFTVSQGIYWDSASQIFPLASLSGK